MTPPAAAILAGHPLATLVQAAAAQAAVPPASPPAEVVLFYLFAGLTGGAAVAVVVSRSIVRAAVALMAALAGVAGLFFLLGAEFLAAAQLVVYVGGTLILIVFGVMLTSSSPFGRSGPTRAEAVLAVALAAVLLAALVLARPDPAAAVPLPAAAAPAFLAAGHPAAPGVRYEPGPERLVTDRRLAPDARQALLDRAADVGRPAGAADRLAFARAVDALAAASRGLPARRATDPNAAYPMAGLGVALLGDYLLPFELASVLLLAVMIGAAYLAKARPRDDPGTPAGGPVPAARTSGSEAVAAALPPTTTDGRRAREWS